MDRRRPIRALLGGLALTLPLVGHAATAQEQPAASGARLATLLTRSAVRLVRSPRPQVDTLDAALLLAREAADLDPENADRWRLVRELAVVSEQGDRENPSIIDQANDQILRLEPGDDATRLWKLAGTIDRLDLAEDRARAYEALLDPERAEPLAPAVRSRLALDCARMLYRSGQTQAFSHWLAESLAIDPSNAAAAAEAVGFFRMNVTDPEAEAELLLALYVADPTDMTTQTALATLLLEHGAFRGARRLYRLVEANHRAVQLLPALDLLADHALAEWAAGDASRAEQIIRARQLSMDERLRESLQRENPGVDPETLANSNAPLSPALAAVRVAIAQSRSSPDIQEALARAILSYELTIQRAVEREQPDQDAAERLRLELAWLLLWLGNDVDSAITVLNGATANRPLTDEARARFDGWIALRRGQMDEARGLLEPLAATDPIARLGVALCQLQQQRRKDAARSFLAIAREQPGTLIGVWAQEELVKLLGRRLPISDTATRLEALIQTIPPVMDRYPQDPTLAVGLRLAPAARRFDAFEPVILNIRVTNNSMYPLALDRQGPIRPTVCLILTCTSIGLPGEQRAPPTVVDIGRRLRLEPGQSITVPVDLRETSLGWTLDAVPVQGWIVQARGLINFTWGATAGHVRPHLLGSEARTTPFRIEGVLPTDDWVRSAVDALGNEEARPDPRTLAMLGHLLVATGAAAEQRTSGLRAEARAVIPTAYARLDPVDQAWALGMLPVDPLLNPVLAMARRSDDRLVRIAYLLFRLEGADDPMLDAARRSGDPDLALLAQVMTRYAHTVVQQADGGS